MSIDQLFFLSQKGDVIIKRDFKLNKIKDKDLNEIFFRKVKMNDNNTIGPIFHESSYNFIYILKMNVYFVIATKDNISPSLYLEVLNRLINIIKDHCGIANEESLRKNFILIYEILDEYIDFGYPQLDSTDQIKQFVFTEPITILPKQENFFSFKPSFLHPNTVASTATQTPISKANNNEIFVDIFEKITMLINSSGSILNSSIDGCIQMKSYLKNKPELNLIFNEDVVIRKNNTNNTNTINYINNKGSGIIIEDCNFHQSVNANNFDIDNCLVINPPDGEFIAMNYRINSEFLTPFKIFTYIDESEYRIELKIKIVSMYNEKINANGVIVKFNVPKKCESVKFDITEGIGDDAKFIEEEKACYWKITKFAGNSEHILIAKIRINDKNIMGLRKEIGPISLNFEIPMYVPSKIQIKFLKIMGDDKNNVNRWIRYITQVSSFVVRIF